MRRTASAGRARPVVLMVLAALCALAWLPNQAFAQAAQGAGAVEPSQLPAAGQATESQPAQPQTQQPASKTPKPSKTKAKGKTSAPASRSSVKPTLAQFAWLAGRWQGNWGPRTAQQVWMPPQSGVMVGVFQLTENDRTLVIELYSIMATPQGIELRVRHFTPALTPWERSGPSLLQLMTYDAKSFLFVNKDNGQPKHWVMKRTDANTYLARFEIVPEKGEVESAEIVYHRQASPVMPSH